MYIISLVLSYNLLIEDLKDKFLDFVLKREIESKIKCVRRHEDLYSRKQMQSKKNIHLICDESLLMLMLVMFEVQLVSRNLVFMQNKKRSLV